jgi:hypothetical protein
MNSPLYWCKLGKFADTITFYSAHCKYLINMFSIWFINKIYRPEFLVSGQWIRNLSHPIRSQIVVYQNDERTMTFNDRLSFLKPGFKWYLSSLKKIAVFIVILVWKSEDFYIFCATSQNFFFTNIKMIEYSINLYEYHFIWHKTADFILIFLNYNLSN